MTVKFCLVAFSSIALSISLSELSIIFQLSSEELSSEVSASAPLELGSFSGNLSANPMDRHTLFGFLGFIFLQEKIQTFVSFAKSINVCLKKRQNGVKGLM